MVTGGTNRAIADLITEVTGDPSEGALHPALTASLAHGLRDFGDHGLEADLGLEAGVAQLLDLPVVLAETRG